VPGIDLNSLYPLGLYSKTQLHRAAGNGLAEIVQYLADNVASAEIFYKVTEGRGTPLFQAAQNVHCNTVQALLDLGANNDATGVYGESVVGAVLSGKAQSISKENVHLVEILSAGENTVNLNAADDSTIMGQYSVGTVF
jgi:ankyrin repeat protein